MGKALDRVPIFKNLWYEDKDGNVLDFDPIMDDIEYKEKFYQVSNFLEIRSSMHSGNESRKDNFVVRFLKWLLRKLPSSWHSDSVNISGHCTVNGAWPIVKYLVEERGWKMHDACVLYGSCCERCDNILTWEALGQAPDPQYLKESRTWCYYCKYVDPDYHNKKFIKDIYTEYFFYTDKNITHKLREYRKEPPKDEGI